MYSRVPAHDSSTVVTRVLSHSDAAMGSTPNFNINLKRLEFPSPEMMLITIHESSNDGNTHFFWQHSSCPNYYLLSRDFTR